MPKFNFDVHFNVDKPFNLDVTIHGDSKQAYAAVSSVMCNLVSDEK